MELVTEIAKSQVVWSILCILLTAAVIKEMRIENVTRETKLIDLYINVNTNMYIFACVRMYKITRFL